MALPDELSAANIAILVSKSAAEAVRVKLAYDALSFVSSALALVSGSLESPYPGMRDVAEKKKIIRNYRERKRYNQLS